MIPQLKLSLEIHPTDLHVGGRIRDRRKKLGMSQADLAAGVGITFQQIQKYERAANRVSASRLLQISKVLKVSISHFFDGLDHHNQHFPSTLETVVMEFLATSEGNELAVHFSRLSPALRTALKQAIKALADEGSSANANISSA